jgi:multiple sugar transport system substrate-binding protein
MIYRQDLYQQRGVQLPETWDDLRAAARGITRREGDVITLAGFAPRPFANQQFVPALWQNGGEALSADGRTARFGSPEGVDALTYWADFLNSLQPAGTTLAPTPSTLNPLLAGTIAGQLANPGVMNQAVTSAPEAVPLLAVRPPLKRKAQVLAVFPNWFGVGTQSKVPDLAWAFLLHVNQPELLLEYDHLLSTVAPRRSLQDAGYMADPRFQMKQWIENVDKWSRPFPVFPNYDATIKALNDALADVLAGKQAPQPALDAGAREFQRQLDESYARA